MKWTEKELDYVKEFYPTEDTEIIAKELGRPSYCVKVKANSLGIKKSKEWDLKLGKIRRKYSDEVILDLYNRGLTHRQIAKKLGTSHNVISYRLGILGLKANGLCFKNKGKFDDNSLLELYYSGLSNNKISKKLGVTHESVRMRLSKLGIHSRFKNFGKKISNEELINLWKSEKLTLEEMARRLNVDLRTVWVRMKRLKLKPHFKDYSPLSKISDDELMLRYEEGFTNKQIAKEFNMSNKSIYDRIKKLGLESNKNSKYGTYCLAKDGHKVKSLEEKDIDDFLYENNIPHEVEPSIPLSRKKADWKIGNLFVEYFGLSNLKGERGKRYTDTIKFKIGHCKQNNLPLLCIFPHDDFRIKLGFLVNKNILEIKSE